MLILAICAAGLLTAWLAHGTAGAYGRDNGNDVTSGVPSPTTSGAVSTEAKEHPAAMGTPETPASALAPPTSDTPSPAGPEVAPSPEQGVASLPVSSAPLRVRYPKAEMDVVIHPLEPHADSQSIEPPVTTEGYWLTPFGLPGAGSTDTTYIVGHSWLDRDAPFNHLSSAAHEGDELTVTTATGVIAYRVESVITYSKSALKDSPIWAVVPNRLVLVSCYSQDPWGRNVVVVASPAPAI
ncbi:sortase [Arthrobacter sp. R1-13]